MVAKLCKSHHKFCNICCGQNCYSNYLMTETQWRPTTCSGPTCSGQMSSHPLTKCQGHHRFPSAVQSYLVPPPAGTCCSEIGQTGRSGSGSSGHLVPTGLTLAHLKVGQSYLFHFCNSVTILTFQTEPTVKTQIRLPLHLFICIFWPHYSRVKPYCWTFRTVTVMVGSQMLCICMVPSTAVASQIHPEIYIFCTEKNLHKQLRYVTVRGYRYVTPCTALFCELALIVMW